MKRNFTTVTRVFRLFTDVLDLNAILRIFVICLVLQVFFQNICICFVSYILLIVLILEYVVGQNILYFIPCL